MDTNVLARAMIRDDQRQAVIADAVLAAGAFVPLTVLLETAWLLGSRYRVGRAVLADTLYDLLDLPNISFEEEDGVRWAIDRFRGGADIADAIHVVASGGAASFATFDDDAFKLLANPPIAIEVLK